MNSGAVGANGKRFSGSIDQVKLQALKSQEKKPTFGKKREPLTS